MPRNMSMAATIEQYKAQTKTQTRREGWWFLKPGDVLNGVEKAMGLKKGEKIVRLGQHRVVSTRPEPLNHITPEDVIAEGFPDWTPEQFVALLVEQYKCPPDKTFNVIEYEYLDEKECL